MTKIKGNKRLKNSIYILSIRHGLMQAIPFLILGAFSLLLSSFPVDAYLDFIGSFHHGAIVNVLTTVYNVTLGSIALLLIVNIAYSFGKLTGDDYIFFYPVTALVSYTAFCGGFKDGISIFNPEWVFTSMVITLLSCTLFRKGMAFGSKMEKLHTAGAEYLFNKSIQAIFPVVCSVVLFASIGGIMRAVLGDINITNFGSYFFLKLFEKVGKGLFGAMLYVFFVHFLWFFGIHGTNTLEIVAQRVLEPVISINKEVLQAGSIPTEIFSKSFLDTFAFVGGCGAALCLVIAILLVSKKSHNRKLAKVTSLSVLFNINEIVIFGFPVIFNPIMLVPFILTPLVLMLSSAFAMYFGLVPVVSHSVKWTVPIFLSGYIATGSMKGSILQLFNLALGVLIYIPFVRISEEKQTKEFVNSTKAMTADMAMGEAVGIIPNFLSDNYEHHFAARTLASDLRNAMQRNQLQLYYQVQMGNDEQLFGAEALLRWKHPVAGFISPPLLIALANEDGFLYELGLYIIERTCKDVQQMEQYRQDMDISINISPRQLENESFVEDALNIIGKYDISHTCLTFEVTERALLNTSELIIDRIQLLRSKGIAMSMDDFGMGHSSMMYLQESAFDEVKLDGSLVKNISDNDRSKEIVTGVIDMAKKLNYHVVAEFVETKEQRDILSSLGCDIYQGYYYGKAMPPKDFVENFLKNKSA